MTNERDESGGCGASIGKIFTMVGLAIISMVKFSDDLIRGCSHSSGSVDNLLQKVGRIHPPRNSTSLEVIPKVSDNTFITEIEHVPSINNFSTNEHFLKDFFTKNSRFSESEKKLLSKNLQQNSEQTIKQLIQYETDVKKLNNAFGKDDKLLILEIGLCDGKSLKTWYEYLPNSIIIGLDIDDKPEHNNDRVFTFKLDQSNPDQLKDFVKE